MDKELDPLINDYLMKSSKNLFQASISNDPELALAVMVNLKSTLDSYIEIMQAQRSKNESY